MRNDSFPANDRLQHLELDAAGVRHDGQVLRCWSALGGSLQSQETVRGKMGIFGLIYCCFYYATIMLA